MARSPERGSQLSGGAEEGASVEQMTKWIKTLQEMIRFCDSQSRVEAPGSPKETEVQQVIRQFERIRDYFYANIDTTVRLQNDSGEMMELHEETVPACALDAEGGYYDDDGYYHDGEGGCFAPAGFVPEGYVLFHDEQGNAYFVPENQESAAGDAVLQLKNGFGGLVEDLQTQEQETVAECVLEAEGGYYDEDGCYNDSEGRCISPAGTIPEFHVLCHDEQENAYFQPSAANQEFAAGDEVLQLQNDFAQMMELRKDPQSQQQPLTFPGIQAGYYDEAGLYHDSEGRCFAPAGFVPDGHVLCHDEHGIAYFQPLNKEFADGDAVLQLQNESEGLEKLHEDGNSSFEPSAEQQEAAKGKKKLTKSEKEQVRNEHAAELRLLGPSTLRIKEEELGLKKLRKPTIMYLNGFTTIATSDGVFLQPYHFRDRYPGYVRDIEEIEGSFDPALRETNPPKHVSNRSDSKCPPKPYKGEQPKLKKKKNKKE